MFLADAKIADHQEDAPGLRWRWLRRLFSSSLRRAERDLESYGVPLKQIRSLLAGQKGREGQCDAGVRYWAEPTAEVTALFFAHGSPCDSLPMLKLGRAFGVLIYTLDAWEDRERDLRRSEFNALAAAYGEDVEAMRALLRELQAETEAALVALPLSESDRQLFLLRLRSNVSGRLRKELRVLHSCRSQGQRSWQEAKALARELASRWKTPTLAPALLLPVIAIAWLAPQYARQTHSYKECLGLTLNLMAIGAVLTPRGIKEKKGNCCGSCDCGDCGDGCNSCDGCCIGSECCSSCACDSCCCSSCDCGACDCGGCDCS